MPAPPGPPAGVVQSIQVLRGLAALSVVLCHAIGRAGDALETAAVGVDVFFVISGFIMWTITASGTASGSASGPVTPGHFLLDRLTRIAPPYVLLTFAVFLLATLVPAAFPNMRTNLSHALLSALFVPHLSPLGTEYPQIAPGWTLNIELFFYALVALTLGAAPRWRLGLLAGVLSVFALVGMATVARPDATGGVAFGAYTSPLLLEFVAGLLLGVLWERRALPRAAIGGAMVAAGIGALVAWGVFLDTLPLDARPLVWGVPAALVVGGALAIERDAGARGGMRAPRGLMRLGDASYALYLTHILTVGAAWRLAGGLPLPLYLLVAVTLSVLVALAFRRVVEAPLTRAVRRAVHRAVPPALGPRAAGPAPAPR